MKMDTSGKPVRDADQPGGSSLLRTVSFPNMLRSLWDHHHHGTDSLGQSICSSNTSAASSNTHIADVAADVAAFPMPMMSDELPAAGETRRIRKISRSDSWSEFNTEKLDRVEPDVQPTFARPPQIRGGVNSMMAAESTRSRHHSGSLLAALLRHELTAATQKRSAAAVDARVAAGGASTTTQHRPRDDRNGMLGLPSRVTVTGRELNMMSPISF